MVKEEIVIRSMELRDVAQVEKIEQDTFSQPWTADDFLDGIQKADRIYMVAEQSGEVLGYCGMWNVAGEGQITNVAVKKQHRRKGIAVSMLSEFLKKGQQQGISAYTLEVRSSNAGAMALYEKMGFKNCGTRKNFYTLPVEDAVIMWKILEKEQDQ